MNKLSELIKKKISLGKISNISISQTLVKIKISKFFILLEELNKDNFELDVGEFINELTFNKKVDIIFEGINFKNSVSITNSKDCSINVNFKNCNFNNSLNISNIDNLQIDECSFPPFGQTKYHNPELNEYVVNIDANETFLTLVKLNGTNGVTINSNKIVVDNTEIRGQSVLIKSLCLILCGSKISSSCPDYLEKGFISLKSDELFFHISSVATNGKIDIINERNSIVIDDSEILAPTIVYNSKIFSKDFNLISIKDERKLMLK